MSKKPQIQVEGRIGVINRSSESSTFTVGVGGSKYEYFMCYSSNPYPDLKVGDLVKVTGDFDIEWWGSPEYETSLSDLELSIQNAQVELLNPNL